MEANKILMQSLYKDIILEFSKETDKGLDESIDLFYTSETYELISYITVLQYWNNDIYQLNISFLEHYRRFCLLHLRNVNIQAIF